MKKLQLNIQCVCKTLPTYLLLSDGSNTLELKTKNIEMNFFSLRAENQSDEFNFDWKYIALPICKHIQLVLRYV